ncbi:MAG: hypothetical protein ACFFAE_16660 [Candidatus Hodarchaeota archaeon]
MNMYLSRDVNQQHQSSLLYYAALAVGVLMIAFSLYFWIPDYVRVILASAFMVLGVSYSLLASRQSSRDFSFFVTIILGVLTIGVGLIFLPLVEIILLVGFLAIAFSLTYYKSRSSTRSSSFFVMIALGILTGSVLLTVFSFIGLSNVYLGSFLVASILGLMVFDL